MLCQGGERTLLPSRQNQTHGQDGIFAIAFAGLTHAQDSLDPKSRQELKRADLTGTNMEVIISVIENQPGETIERHIHHGEEAFYVLQGATLETADGKQITLPAGASAINRHMRA